MHQTNLNAQCVTGIHNFYAYIIPANLQSIKVRIAYRTKKKGANRVTVEESPDNKIKQNSGNQVTMAGNDAESFG